MDSVSKLIRFAYLGSIEAYYANRKKPMSTEEIEQNLSFIKTSITPSSVVGVVPPAEGVPASPNVVDPVWPLTTIKKVMQSKSLLRNDEAILILAYCTCKVGNLNLKIAIYQAIPDILPTPSDFFLFIHFVNSFSEGKGFGRGLRTTISKWYAKKTAIELAEIFGKNRQHYCWSHSDIIKLSHMKFDDTDLDKKQILLAAKKRGCQIIKTQDTIECIENYPGFQRLCNISRLKVCENPVDAADLIRVHFFSIQYVPAHLLKTSEVWDALLPTLTYQELLKYIPFLTDSKLLKPAESFAKKFCQAIANPLLIQAAKVHPMDILFTLKQHETQRRYCETVKEEHYKKKLGSRKIGKNQFLIKKLQIALNHSFAYFPKTGLRYFITIDLRHNSMKKSVFGFNILTNMEVSILMALALLKREKEVTIMLYTSTIGTLAPLDLKKEMTYEEAIEYCKGLPKPQTKQKLSTPLKHALQSKKKSDVFLTFVDSVARSARDNKPPAAEFEEYKKKMSLKHTKYIIFNLSRKPHDLKIDPDNFLSKGMLEICGFNLKVPKFVETYVKNQFY